MTGPLAHPLQGLIAKAAQTLPARTGMVATVQERMQRIGQGGTVILADVSGSMKSVAWGGRTKHSVLREAIAATMERGPFRLIAFAAAAVELSSAAQLPAADGGAALHLGLQAASACEPGRILVISDGAPDSEEAALQQAASFGGVIDVLYIGPDSDAAAMSFLQRLARAGHGCFHGSDIARAGQPTLGTTVQQLLLGKS